jgi:diaminopimelate decarboxylase
LTRGDTSTGARPPAFTYRQAKGGILRSRPDEDVLHCEKLPVETVAQRFGTPLYLYSAAAIRHRLQAFEQPFRGLPHTICYSVKANSTLAVLRLLAKQGCGFDVVSGGELERALRIGRHAAKRVVFSGVGKTAEEMQAALKADILLFNVESESELWRLAECAARMKTTAQVALRVNPNIPAATHPYISTGLQQHKFGVPGDKARRLYAQTSATRYLRASGVSVHIGSQITDVAPFAAAMERVAQLVRELRRDGHEIEYVDAGGGLGIDYGEAGLPEFADHVGSYAAALLRPLRGLEIHLLIEPGRSLVAPAGALVTRVIYYKQNGSKKFLVVDAAMNDFLRPSLYSAYHEIVPVRRRGEHKQVVDVVGPICETGDFFARDRRLPVVEEGDLLAILDAGAYGMVLASNYNTRPRAAEVLVDGKSARLIRRRETISDLLRLEV